LIGLLYTPVLDSSCILGGRQAIRRR